MTTLNNKIAIVTGASSGIGRAAAELFAREGAALVLSGRRQAALDEVIAHITAAGGRAVAVAGDVSDDAHARTLGETAIKRLGGLDIAFNNAGTPGIAAPVPGLSGQTRRGQPRGGGSLIFTSTFVGHTVGFPGMGAYAASKAGLVGLTQVIAAEFGAKGIRANALLPGGTDTPMGRAVSNTPEMRAFVEGLHALKRLAEPQEIAQAALFLASDASSFVTGTALLADGGVSITRT